MTTTLEPDALACTQARARLAVAATVLEEYGNGDTAAALRRLADYMNPRCIGMGIADTARALLGVPLATALATEDTYRTAECEVCGQEADVDGEGAFIDGDHVHDVDPEGTWASMPDAPRDGRVVEGRYDNGEIVRIRWAEDRVCVLSTEAPGAGQFGPGWEDEANGLYVDDPESWRPLSEVAGTTVGA